MQVDGHIFFCSISFKMTICSTEEFFENDVYVAKFNMIYPFPYNEFILL